MDKSGRFVKPSLILRNNLKLGLIKFCLTLQKILKFPILLKSYDIK